MNKSRILLFLLLGIGITILSYSSLAMAYSIGVEVGDEFTWKITIDDSYPEYVGLEMRVKIDEIDNENLMISYYTKGFWDYEYQLSPEWHDCGKEPDLFCPLPVEEYVKYWANNYSGSYYYNNFLRIELFEDYTKEWTYNTKNGVLTVCTIITLYTTTQFKLISESSISSINILVFIGFVSVTIVAVCISVKLRIKSNNYHFKKL